MAYLEHGVVSIDEALLCAPLSAIVCMSAESDLKPKQVRHSEHWVTFVNMWC